MPGLPGGISGPFPYHLSDDAAYEHQQEAHEKTLRLRASMDDTEVDEEEELTFPNPLARIRYQYVRSLSIALDLRLTPSTHGFQREYTAEFFATMLVGFFRQLLLPLFKTIYLHSLISQMICFGTGVDCQVTLSGLAKGSYLSIRCVFFLVSSLK